MASVSSRLAEARGVLKGAGFSNENAALDAEVLARHLLGWDRATLIARSRESEPDGFAEPFLALIARRAAREPVAQLVGHREFWGLDFEVTRDVLVPRPETELIVEEALAFAAEFRVGRVADVGTGSGCLAVSIAHELCTARVTATDRSGAALSVARRNAIRHDVDSRIGFLETDLLDGVSGPMDLIVSNPPYVPQGVESGMAPDVVQYEPHTALFAGPTGLEVIARLLQQAGSRLAAGGRLVVEFGFGQDDDVIRLAQNEGWRVLRVREDLQSIPRAIVLTRTDHG